MKNSMKKTKNYVRFVFFLGFVFLLAGCVKMESVPETAETEEITQIQTETETQTESETPIPETQSETEAIGPLVAIDAGHQSPDQDTSGTEPNAPGSDVMKTRSSVGTSGCVSGKDEYELNLEVALKLKQELLSRGYQVVMTRETHDVNLSNIERCQVASDAGADIMVRLHANGSDDSSASGALTIAPTESNPYTQEIYAECVRLSTDVLNAYCAATGLTNCDIWYTDDMTGINWSDIPVTYLEMGFMTNPYDDAYMAEDANQEIMAKGVADGIDAYFAGQ